MGDEAGNYEADDTWLVCVKLTSNSPINPFKHDKRTRGECNIEITG